MTAAMLAALYPQIKSATIAAAACAGLKTGSMKGLLAIHQAFQPADLRYAHPSLCDHRCCAGVADLTQSTVSVHCPPMTRSRCAVHFSLVRSSSYWTCTTKKFFFL